MGLNSPLSNPLGQELGMDAVTASECVRAQRFHPPRLRHGKERGGGAGTACLRDGDRCHQPNQVTGFLAWLASRPRGGFVPPQVRSVKFRAGSAEILAQG